MSYNLKSEYKYVCDNKEALKRLMQEEISSCFNVIIPEIDESLSFKKYKEVRAIVKDIAKRKCLKIAW